MTLSHCDIIIFFNDYITRDIVIILMILSHILHHSIWALHK